jgi:hypothetical protein
MAFDKLGCPTLVFLRVGLFPRFLNLQIHPIHSDQTGFASEVKRLTTPRPILRMPHQSAIHMIRVHVIQLLVLLFMAIHVEVVKSCLPKPWQLTEMFLQRVSAAL